MNQPDYSSARYCTPLRMASYGYQIGEVISEQPHDLLEVGIGNGVVTYILRQAGIKVTTLDVERELKPDVVASVLELPFDDNAFDGALCCQVLEHLPFESFVRALSELRRVTRLFAVVSLPDVTRHYRIEVRLPKLRFKLGKDVLWMVPRHQYDGQHHWEIGKRGYPLSLVSARMGEAGFRCVRQYRAWEWPYHHFFVLRKA
jgi:ubiquinone/menaquinone biosynthesis C-methylase UbiE